MGKFPCLLSSVVANEPFPSVLLTKLPHLQVELQFCLTWPPPSPPSAGTWPTPGRPRSASPPAFSFELTQSPYPCIRKSLGARASARAIRSCQSRLGIPRAGREILTGVSFSYLAQGELGQGQIARLYLSVNSKKMRCNRRPNQCTSYAHFSRWPADDSDDDRSDFFYSLVLPDNKTALY